MIQKGKVTAVLDGVATVSVERISACSGCSNKNNCTEKNSCASCRVINVEAQNTLHAKTGDIVEIYSPTSSVLGISFCVFVLPLIFSIIAFIVADGILKNPADVYIVFFAAFILSEIFFCILFNKKLRKNNKVKIIKIIKEFSEE